MSTTRKFNNMSVSDTKFAIRTELAIQHMKETKFINTANGQIIARRMKGQSNKRLISLKLLFHLEIEHSQQLASIILVVPYSNSTVQLTTGCN